MHFKSAKLFSSVFLQKLRPGFAAWLLIIFFLAGANEMKAQEQILRNAGGRIRQMGNRFAGGASNDSLKRRDANEDSITIRFRYLDSTRMLSFDSSINDFSKRFPVPATYINLGNNGTAARNLLFDPRLQSGWDPGFHALDIYSLQMDKVRFFTTTRPYTELNYQLASRAEQIIDLLHTQNIKPNWNFSFRYRLINSPGFFKNQKSNHNNYLFSSWYQGVKKRYNAYFVLLGNKMQIGENGGIQDTADFLNDPVYRDRFNIFTKLGGDPVYGSNFFSTDVGTGNRYNQFSALLRQQYDLGRKDSIVTDSTIIPLFYPRLRFEHTFRFSQNKYKFRDYLADSIYYQDKYQQTLADANDSFVVQDKWREIYNDFSIIQFPDPKNQQQFFKVGASLQLLQLSNSRGNNNFANTWGHAEYRNRTRNGKWDMVVYGDLYFTGLNAGDYRASATLQRLVGKRKGFVKIGADNINRRPAFSFDDRSEFYFMSQASDLRKENIVHLHGTLYQPSLQLTLAGHYYLITNYSYLRNFYEWSQEGTAFNVLRIEAQKTFNLGRSWKWHADVYFQQRIGNGPLNLPGIFTRHRIGYEGSLGFKNLDIAFGLEGRYHTAYKTDDYSPIMGSFQYQDTTSIKNQLPHIAGYVHFRIRSFKMYIRAENLNTARLNDGFGFTNNIVETPGYPYPGMILRFGIYWSFVN